MRIDQYFILSVIVALAPVIGYIISLYVKEELKQFLKSVRFIQLAIIFYLLGVFVMADLQPWILVILVFGLIVLELMKHDTVFSVLGILFFVTASFQKLAIYGTLGIFFYGLFYGIGMAKRPVKELYFPSFLFFIFSSVFFIIALLI